MLALVQSSPLMRPAANAHLYLWVTNTYLPAGLQLMSDLGFTYKTNVAWVKTRAGLGQYFRGKHELMLFGVRGRGFAGRTARRDLPSAIVVPAGAHSAKPREFYQLVEDRSVGPYAELFSRTTRPGWAVWGNEADVPMPPAPS